VEDNTQDAAQETEVQAVEAAQDNEGTVEDVSENNEPQQTETEDDAEELLFKGEEPAEEEKDNSVIRNFRKREKLHAAKIRELESQLQQYVAPKQAKDELGQRPSLWDYEGDEEVFGRELEKWVVKKAEYDAKLRDQQTEQERLKQEDNELIQSVSQNYEKLKERRPDAEEALEIVNRELTAAQLTALYAATRNNPATTASIIYQLGYGLLNDDPEAKAIAAIRYNGKNDQKASEALLQFSAAIGGIQNRMKNAPKKVVPAPEKRVAADKVGVVSEKNTLEALEKEAHRTGDRTALIHYKLKLKGKT